MSNEHVQIDEQLEELARLIARTPLRRRYVLVQRASGELAFVQHELDAVFEQAIAAAFGEPKPRRRVIKIDPPSVSHALEDMWARPSVPDGFGPPDAEPPIPEPY